VTTEQLLPPLADTKLLCDIPLFPFIVIIMVAAKLLIST